MNGGNKKDLMLFQCPQDLQINLLLDVHELVVLRTQDSIYRFHSEAPFSKGCKVASVKHDRTLVLDNLPDQPWDHFHFLRRRSNINIQAEYNTAINKSLVVVNS